MSDLSIEYSLNTPVFNNSITNLNILNKKLVDIVKNNNIQNGGFDNEFNLDMSNYISLLIGIIIIIIGFILLWFKNDFIEIEAIIRTQTCDEINDKMCKINIIYNINSIQYSKIITTIKNFIPNTPTIKIYYQESNPNLIQLYNPNYSVIGIGMIIVGAFIMIFSMETNNLGINGSILDFTKTNLYSNSTNMNGLNVVYSSE